MRVFQVCFGLICFQLLSPSIRAQTCWLAQVLYFLVLSPSKLQLTTKQGPKQNIVVCVGQPVGDNREARSKMTQLEVCLGGMGRNSWPADIKL